MLATEILRIVLGLAAVIGMIGLAAYGAQRAGFRAMTGVAGRKRRLSVKELLPIDPRRKLAIVKCDDTEYLIIFGPNGETVVDKELRQAVDAEKSDAIEPPANPFANLGNIASKLRISKKEAA